MLGVYAGEADGMAIDRAVDLAERNGARLTIAVPVREPTSLAYLTPFVVHDLHTAFETEAERNRLAALERIPGLLPVTVHAVKRDGAATFLAAVSQPVDLLVFRREAGERGPDRRLFAPLLRAARKAGANFLGVRHRSPTIGP